MGNEVIEKKNVHAVPALFEHLGIKNVKSSDRFTISYKDGLLEANVKRKSGQTETVVKYVKGSGFNQITTFDPELLSKVDRNDLIKMLYSKGETQKDLEKKFGLSQAMISKIVNS